MTLSHKTLSRLRTAAAAVLLGLTAASCSQISEPDRRIPVPPAEVKRAVLIEDYTGQNCINCPTAHEVIDELVAQFGEAVIPVSIHAGGLAIGVDKTRFPVNYIGLKTEQGQQMNDRLAITQWPMGTVNGGATMPESGWAAAVRNAMGQESVLDVKLSAKMQPDSLISIEAVLSPRADFKGQFQLWVVESGIVARQRLLDGSTDKEYVHNNVFREAVGGIDGQAVQLTKGLHQTVEASTKLRYNDQERWNADNLAVVAVVRNADGTVAQCARAKMSR